MYFFPETLLLLLGGGGVSSPCILLTGLPDYIAYNVYMRTQSTQCIWLPADVKVYKVIQFSTAHWRHNYIYIARSLAAVLTN